MAYFTQFMSIITSRAKEEETQSQKLPEAVKAPVKYFFDDNLCGNA